MAHVLTVNAGSSSLKFGLFAMTPSDPAPVFTGLAERIGGTESAVVIRASSGEVLLEADGEAFPSHEAALDRVLRVLSERFPEAVIRGVGHRIVHGGPDRDAPAVLSKDVLADLTRFEPFAPLHQPANLSGVRAAMARFPDAVQIACFDTAFHRHHPWVNDTFALPRQLYQKGVRRYGFHGLSYDYISGHLAQSAPLLHAGRVVVAHLGNGASMCAMLGGRSVGSTMGFSALDGLPMGTRCGQLDPGVVLYLMDQEGMDAGEISDLLYKQSGLLGLSGESNDMRTLEASDTPEARQAIDYFTFRIRRELGALAAVLGGLDALVFTGGIGENSAAVRAEVCKDMSWIGIELDGQANRVSPGEISSGLSRVRVLVIPTNEELVIARAAADAVRGRQLGGIE